MNIGDPQSFNRYAYVSGDPVNFIDPSGLIEGPPCEGGRPVFNSNGIGIGWICPVTRTYGPGGGGGGGRPPIVDTGGGRGSLSLPTQVNEDDDTFQKCVERGVLKGLKRFEEDNELLIGQVAVKVGFSTLAALVALVVAEPTPLGELTLAGLLTALVTVSAVVYAVNAVVDYIFEDARLRNALKRGIEDAIEECKVKPGTPSTLPSANEVLEVFTRRK